MNGYPHYPDGLSQGEFAVVRYRLELAEAGRIALADLLGLRQALRRSALAAIGPRAAALFDPPLSADPVALRRFQKPAPGFVLLPDPNVGGELREWDRIDLDLLFLGSAIAAIDELGVTLQRLGEDGLPGGGPRFEVAAASSLGPDGVWQLLWQAAPPPVQTAPALLRIDQWLDGHWPERTPLLLEFMTPVRLVTAGRALRQPRFDQLFPFLLRRVTAMLHTHCSLEPVTEPAALLQAARQVVAGWDAIRWHDWRAMPGHEPVGGLTGRLQLEGPGLEELIWILLLATLFGVGKGAAYGAGRCRLLAAG